MNQTLKLRDRATSVPAVMVGLLMTLILPSLSPAVEPATKTESAPVNDGFKISSTDWPWWRGPHRNGEAFSEQNPPLQWTDTKNIIWKSPIVGRGHASPIVVGAYVLIATADEEVDTQSVVAFDRMTGTKRWETVVHAKGSMRKNTKSSAASGSVACDGERIYVNFANSDAVFTTALDMSGKQVWQTKVTDYAIHQGYAASPALYQSLVLVSADSKTNGAVAALRRETGEVVWKQSRPQAPNYTSPIILRIGGIDQLIMTGCDLVTSFDPLTGKKHWEIEGATTECVTSTVTDGRHVFSSGGYPSNHISAIVADGSGKVAWRIDARVYVPSLLYRDGYLYGVMDAGIAACWKCDTGEEVWKSRLGGTFSSSPVLVGENVYVTNEEGESFVFVARPEKFELLGKNKLGTEVFATPTICGDRIYMRVTETIAGKRQEVLYCLGK